MSSASKVPLVSDVARAKGLNQASFLSSAERSLADVFRELELDAAHTEDTEFAVYFDAAQVRGMVLGMYSFSDPMHFAKDRGPAFKLRNFFREKALVEALASAGLFGKVRMLPPHQAEVERLKSFNFAIPFDPFHSPKAFAYRFAKAVADESNIQLEVKAEEKEYGGEIMYTMANRFAPRHQFQFLQSIQGGPSTYNATAEQWLIVEKYKESDFVDLVVHPLFDHIRLALDEERPQYSKSNIADAMAFVALAQHVAAYRDKKTNIAPRYYVAEGHPLNDRLESILKRSGAWDALSYEVCADGERASVLALKTWDYFVMKAIVGADPSEADEVNLEHHSQKWWPDRKYWLTDMRATFERLGETANRKLWATGGAGALRARINDVIDAAFLDAVLSPYVEKSRAKALVLLQRHEEMYAHVAKQTIGASGKSKQALAAFTWETLVRTTQMWWTFARLRENVSDFYIRVHPKGHRLWLTLRVFHLNLPAEVEQQVVAWVGDTLTLDGYDSLDVRDKAWREIMKAYGRTREAHGPLTKEDVTTVASVAVILLMGRDPEFYEVVLDLLDRHDLREEPWTLLIRMHCKWELKRFTDWQDDVSALAFRYSMNPSPSLAIAAAVAFGRLAGRSSIRAGQSQEAKGLWAECYRYANRVATDDQATDEEQAFAWNVMLHCSIHQRPWQQARADTAAKQLQTYEGTEAWQFIFSGTLAEYCLEKARRNPQNGFAYLNMAEQFANEARRGPWARDVDLIRFNIAEQRRKLDAARRKSDIALASIPDSEGASKP